MIAQLMHLPFLTELDDLFDMVALCDHDRSLAGQLARRHHVPAVCDSVQDLLPGVDAVVILNRDHFAPALAALDRGVHVFTEKPLCYTMGEAEQLIAASARTGAKLMVGYMKRYDIGVRRGLAEIRATAGVRMARVHVVVGPDYGNWIVPELRTILRPDTTDHSDADGRLPKVVAEFGITSQAVLAAYMDMFGVWSHDINLYRAAFPDRPTSISAQVARDGTVLTALLGYADGFQCVFQGGVTAAHLFEESLTVWGAERVVSVDVTNPFLRHVPATVRIREDDARADPASGRGLASERIITGTHDEAFKAQLRHFHECVTTSSCRPLTDGRESLADMRLMTDILRAADQIR
jgi:predicted dehydrogenase